MKIHSSFARIIVGDLVSLYTGGDAVEYAQAVVIEVTNHHSTALVMIQDANSSPRYEEWPFSSMRLLHSRFGP